MPGVTMLDKIQLGREATAGTAVAATTVWRGEGVGEDQLVTQFPVENVGILPGTDRSFISQLGAIATLTQNATFEQLLHVLEAGVKTIGTGAADGAGTDKIYDYLFATTALPTIKTYTIEAGDNNQAEKMEFGFVESFQLDGKAGEGITLTSNWRGRQWVPTTYTAALAIPTVEDMMMTKTKLYMDAVGGTMGTTQVSNSLLSMSLKVATGLKAIFTADGNKFFSFVKLTKPVISLQVVFEHDANALAEKINWRAATPRLLRLQTTGSNLTTPGTAFSVKTVNVDLAGNWTKWGALASANGNNTVAGTFNVLYDPTAAFYADIKVVNQLAAVP